MFICMCILNVIYETLLNSNGIPKYETAWHFDLILFRNLRTGVSQSDPTILITREHRVARSTYLIDLPIRIRGIATLYKALIFVHKTGHTNFNCVLHNNYMIWHWAFTNTVTKQCFFLKIVTFVMNSHNLAISNTTHKMSCHILARLEHIYKT